MARLISSAKRLGRQLVEFGKSFKINKNNNGPRDDPCATLYVIGSTFDLQSLVKVYCFDLKRNLLKDWRSRECRDVLVWLAECYGKQYQKFFVSLEKLIR